jgi:8-oxo-dGTP pyrophosphatase MutT (NUDIX family)
LVIKTNKKNKVHEVVVVLPYTGNKILMQLRDIKPDISFPGKWGFFGGSMEQSEDPKDAAIRELFEEIGYRPKAMHKLERIYISDVGNIISHTFFCHFTESIKTLKLKEGLDLGLFSLDDVLTNKLYSKKNSKYFPIIASKYIEKTIRKLFVRLKEINDS